MSNQVESKVFEVSYDWTGWSARLRINQDTNTRDVMREMLLFWSGGEERIEDSEGDVQEAWLLMFAERAIVDAMDWNVSGIKSQFERREGWAPLDGSCGIELLSSHTFEFDTDDFKVAEVKESESC